MRLRKNDHGIALIVVLWIAVALCSVTIAGAYLTRLEMRQSYYPAREMQLIGAAMASVEKVKVALVSDDGPYDTLKGTWKSSFEKDLHVGDTAVSVIVEDEESKVNMASAFPDRLRELSSLGKKANIDEQLDSLMDWEDADSAVRVNGAEEAYYRTLSRTCKNSSLDCVEELSLVKGFSDRQNIDSLKKVATVSSDGKININTAPAEVLMTLPNVDYLLAQGIIARRNGRDLVQGTEDDLPYDTTQRLTEVVGRDVFRGIENLVTIKSSHFKVTVKASTGKYSKTVEAMLYRQGRNVRTVYWREL